MHAVVMTILSGLIAGSLGVVAGSWLSARSTPATAPAPTGTVTEQELRERLAAVEGELAEQRTMLLSKNSMTPPPPQTGGERQPPSGSASSTALTNLREAREQQREERYDKELADQEVRLFEHATQPIDRQWAGPTEALLLKELAVGESRAKVDCRTHSCVARLSFPSRHEAVGYLRGGFIIPPPGCRSIASVPPRETSGEYELAILFDACNEVAK